MKKIFLILSILLAGLPAFAAETLTGEMTAKSGTDGTGPWDVTATWDSSTKKLVVNDFLGYEGSSVTFTVSVDENKAVAAKQQKVGKYYISSNTSFVDITAAIGNVNGKAQLSCEVIYLKEENLPFGFDQKYDGVVIKFDQGIPELGNEDLPDETEPDTESPLNGTWIFNMTQQNNSNAWTSFSGTKDNMYQATILKNGKITFAWEQSSIQGVRVGDLVGMYDAEKSTITFSKEPTEAGNYFAAAFTAYNQQTQTFTFGDVVAKYNEAAGTLTFPAGAGFVWYDNASTNNDNMKMAPITVNNAHQPKPSVTITSIEPSFQDGDAVFKVNVKDVDIFAGYVHVFYWEGTGQADKSTFKAATDGVAEIKIENLQPGTYTYSFLAVSGDFQSEIKTATVKVPAPAVNLTGTMISYSNEDGTTPVEGSPWNVTATYYDSKLSITGFAGAGYGPINFTVTESTGEAGAEGGQILTGSWTFSGGTSTSTPVNATIGNIGGHAVLKIRTWVLKKNAMPGEGTYYYDTEVTFDKAIEGLPEAGVPDPNSVLNGEWLFKLTSRDANYIFSDTEFKYDATVYTNGDVEFAWQPNQSYRLPNIKGKYNPETGKITFPTTPTGVNYNETALYYQVPVLYDIYNRNYKIQEIEADYDEAAQTITFPASTGFVWFTTPDTKGTPRISTIEYKSARRDVPTLTITSVEYEINDSSVKFTVNVNITKGYGQTAYVYYWINNTPQLEGQKAPVVNGVAEIIITGLIKGQDYDYNFVAKMGDIISNYAWQLVSIPEDSIEPDDPNGRMTDILIDDDTQVQEEWKVKGSVNGTKLTIENFAGYNESVEFNIDLTSGMVQSTKDQTVKDYYFSRSTDNIVYGRMVNISKTQSKLTVYPWQLYQKPLPFGLDVIAEYDGGEIIFDFTVQGLLEEIPAKSIINGDWTFTVTDYSDFSAQLKDNKIPYTAQLFESGVVKFTCTSDMSPRGYDFYGKFNSDTKVLTLDQTPLIAVGNYFVSQQPMKYNTSDNEVVKATVTAPYANNAFTFEANNGMAWIGGRTLGTTDAGALWIWTFNEATQLTHADTEPGTDGVEGVEADENVNVRYFDLQGIEIANPAPGNIYIRVQGDKVSKVVIR